MILLQIKEYSAGVVSFHEKQHVSQMIIYVILQISGVQQIRVQYTEM